MNTDVHCHECGALTRVVREDDGFEMLVCTNDDCPVIGVGQLSRPADEDMCGGRNTLTRFADRDMCTP